MVQVQLSRNNYDAGGVPGGAASPHARAQGDVRPVAVRGSFPLPSVHDLRQGQMPANVRSPLFWPPNRSPRLYPCASSVPQPLLHRSRGRRRVHRHVLCGCLVHALQSPQVSPESLLPAGTHAHELSMVCRALPTNCCTLPRRLLPPGAHGAPAGNSTATTSR